MGMLKCPSFSLSTCPLKDSPYSEMIEHLHWFSLSFEVL